MLKKTKRQPADSLEPGGVDEYIATCPVAVRGALEKIRAAIRSAAPNATETVSYFQMPGYFFPGYDYHGMFAWFSYKQPYVRLHVRPPVITDLQPALAGYKTTRALVSFPMDQEIPAGLVKKLVKASLREMEARGRLDR